MNYLLREQTISISGAIVFPNHEDKDFYDRAFMVVLCSHGIGFHVYASCAQDALDTAADYVKERGWQGYFLSDHEAMEYDEDELAYLGNDCMPVYSPGISLKEV